MQSFTICALYRFVRLENFQDLRQPLLDVMNRNSVRGTLLLAREGINGTIAGSREGIDAVLSHLRADPRLADLDTRESQDSTCPFYRTKVKLKREIVTMGVPDIDPRHSAGTYVEPEDWNALISDPAVTVIDTRNRYEIGVGRFKDAVDPETDNFREFPEYVRSHLDPESQPRVAMYCTGGIRCEKSTAFLREMGFQEVYHLKGGILNYLERVPAEESLWEGECFVFDNRVTVNHRLEKGAYEQCHACRRPIDEEDRKSALYRPGVSCPHCAEVHTDAQRQRYASRQRQMRLAEERGEAHIGTEAKEAIVRRKALKQARRQQEAQDG